MTTSRHKHGQSITRHMHITIGTSPARTLSLAQDLRLLKAALLYGDRVELYSLTASMIAMAMKLTDVPVSTQIRLLELVAPFIKTPAEARQLTEGLETYRRALAVRPRSRDLLLLQRQFETMLAREWVGMRKVTEDLAVAAGFPSIAQAVDAGILELHSFASSRSREQALDFMVDCVALASKSPLIAQRRPQMEIRDDLILTEFVAGISSAVVDGDTFPLFDEQTSSLVDAAVQAGVIRPSPSAVTRAGQPALAAHLLGILPQFENASIEETLAVRKELAPWLARFQGALVGFADTIKVASWDRDFPTDADAVFRRDVAPAIADIEDAISSNNLIVSILRNLVEKPLVLPAGSGIGLAVSSFSSLPHAYALSLGASAAASLIIFDSYKAWQEKNLKVQQNAMYFYYQASKRMSAR